MLAGLYSLTFVVGAFVGSFLNVVVDRLRNGEPMISGRSHCESCKKTLSSVELIPILSFIIQSGKCKSCGQKLSLYYPFSEIITGLSFAAIAYYINLFGSAHPLVLVGFVYLITVASFYIIILLSDLKYRIIPDRVVYPAIIFVLAFLVLNMVINGAYSYLYLKNDAFGRYLLQTDYWQNQMYAMLKGFLWTLLSSAAVSLFFWILISVTRGRGMGGGDAKLGFLIGIFNGFPINVVSIFAGFLLGAVYSLVLVLLRKKGLKDTIAFGPFLILGSLITFVFGHRLLNWYLGLL